MAASTITKRDASAGLKAALGAYGVWGLLPIYWKLLVNVPALAILAHRIIWSLVFVAAIMVLQGNRKELAAGFRNARVATLLFCSSLFIAGDWLLFIWAVNTDQVLATSLGYYINPLVTIFFGFVFFRERVGRLQWLAIAIAAGGVLYQVVLHGNVPWVALGLALTFAFYGLIRKKVVIDSLPGLFAETVYLSLPALLFLVLGDARHTGTFMAGDLRMDLLLVSTGVVTSLPLLWFAYGARRLKLITVGFLQYIAPTLQFFLGVWVFHEPMDLPTLVTFVCIWIALGLYSWGNLAVWKREQALLEPPAGPGGGA
ncbi:MAG: EamA family transporter RarD [Thermovirgaceae bacterium]|nr:EamA family transporter RarD [Synergistales bacterium]